MSDSGLKESLLNGKGTQNGDGSFENPMFISENGEAQSLESSPTEETQEKPSPNGTFGENGPSPDNERKCYYL